MELFFANFRGKIGHWCNLSYQIVGHVVIFPSEVISINNHFLSLSLSLSPPLCLFISCLLVSFSLFSVYFYNNFLSQPAAQICGGGAIVPICKYNVVRLLSRTVVVWIYCCFFHGAIHPFITVNTLLVCLFTCLFTLQSSAFML